jgi:hypothetical protein
MRQESAAVAAPAATTAIRVPGWVYPLVTLASVLLGAEAIVRGTRAVTTVADSDLTNFFFKSADYILRGDIWHMYAVRANGAYPNYNPPLSIVLMAPLLGLARAVHFAANFGEQITFVSFGFIVFVPLLGVFVLRALRELYPEMPGTQRLLAYMLIVLSPLTWQSIATWYHLEQPMMLCFLVAALIAFQQRREGLAGVLAGLALLSRTTALIPLLALGMLLVVSGEWRALLRFVPVTALVTAVGMAPFFLFDRANALYSFVTWRGTAEIGGNSVWSIFAYSGSAGGIRHMLDALARRLDTPAVVLFVVALTYLAFRRFNISPYSRDAWAVLAMAALAVPMLSKTNWPYYYLEPFVLLLVWEFTSMHDRRAGVWRWPVLTFGFLVVAATLSQYIGLRSVGALDRVAVGLLEFGAMLSFVVAIWMRLQAAKPAATASLNMMPSAVNWPWAGPAAPVSRVAPISPVAPIPPVAPVAPVAPPLVPPSAPPGYSTPNGTMGRTSPRDPFGAGAANGGAAGAGQGSRPGSPGASPRPPQPPVPQEWPDLDAGWIPRPPAPPRGDGQPPRTQ